MRAITIVVALVATICINTAARAQDAGVYSNQATMHSAPVKKGVVVQALDVRVEGSQSATLTGSATGAALGGLLGAHVGQGNGRIAAAILGTALGGVAGNVAGDRIGGSSSAQQLIIVVDDGNGHQNMVSVTQAGSKLSAGQKVYVVGETWSGVRIVPMMNM